jgi:NRAMP (natural resistance-associated macrophage protein)-like metal ion transporter
LFVAVGGEDYGAMARGLVPRLGDAQTMSLTVAIIGATVMPHVVYLHSTLHKDRVRAVSPAERRLLATSNKWDCALGLGVAGMLNLAMLCVAAAAFRGGGAGGLDFWFISRRLTVLAGGGAALAFGAALLASGLSASTVGTHAGQVVMSGFTRWRVPTWVRRAVTAVPSLVVLSLPIGPRAGAHLLAGRRVVRDPVRARASAVGDPRPVRHGGHGEPAGHQLRDAHGDPGHCGPERDADRPASVLSHRPAGGDAIAVA